MNEIETIVQNTPNNYDLGKKIRSYSVTSQDVVAKELALNNPNDYELGNEVRILFSDKIEVTNNL